MSSTSPFIGRRHGLTLALSILAVVPLSFPSKNLFAAGQNKIVYDHFDWSIYQSTHFDVYHYSREKGTLQKVVSMAESAYDELSRRLNYQIPKRIPIIYYSTHAEFEQNNIELNFIPEGVGAFAEPARMHGLAADHDPVGQAGLAAALLVARCQGVHVREVHHGHSLPES